jgi:membrane-associated phospholipid phosphatase
VTRLISRTRVWSRAGLFGIGLAVLSIAAGPAPLHAAQPPAVSQIEPGAGAWRTWVLTSGSEIQVPPPPDASATEAEIQHLHELASQRDATALDQIQYWDAGAPSYRWNEIDIDRALTSKAVGLRAIRELALLHTAMYDALVSTWNAKYTYNRVRPSAVDPSLRTVVADPASPSYPSEHAAVAGAAAAVLAYLAPDDADTFAAQAAEAGRSRLLAGVQYPSDVEAGLDLGRAVAARVIERARADGSDAVWDGSMPTGPGLWTGPNPREPLAGTWKTWALTSGSQVRPGPPPAYDSEQTARELAEVKSFARTPATNQAAFFWANPQPAATEFVYWNQQTSRELFENRLDVNPPRAARAYALESIAIYDALVACWDAKYTYWRMRPYQADPTIQPLFPTLPAHPSYPSGESCDGGAVAGVLGYLFPRDAGSLNARAVQSAESRLWAGVHFQSDIDAGLALGGAVARVVIERAQADGTE